MSETDQAIALLTPEPKPYEQWMAECLAAGLYSIGALVPRIRRDGRAKFQVTAQPDGSVLHTVQLVEASN